MEVRQRVVEFDCRTQVVRGAASGYAEDGTDILCHATTTATCSLAPFAAFGVGLQVGLAGGSGESALFGTEHETDPIDRQLSRLE
jgi:hypothetical protein